MPGANACRRAPMDLVSQESALATSTKPPMEANPSVLEISCLRLGFRRVFFIIWFMWDVSLIVMCFFLFQFILCLLYVCDDLSIYWFKFVWTLDHVVVRNCFMISLKNNNK